MMFRSLLFSGLFAALLFPALAVGQGSAEACRTLLHQALENHRATPDSGRTVRRNMHITTVRWTGARLDTLINRAETVNWDGGEVVRSEGMEIWSDDNTMVVVEEKAKRLRIVDLSDKRKIVAAQKRFQGVFPDSLVGYGREFRCEEVGKKGDLRQRISFRIDTTMQAFFNAESMTVEVNAVGEIVRMAITHPAGTAVRSTEYVVEEIDRGGQEIEIGEPVLRHFVDPAGHLRPEYAAYRVAR